jgi:hypothetical protein
MNYILKILLFIAITYFLYNCNTVKSNKAFIENDEEIELSNVQVSDIEENNDTPISGISYEEFEKTSELLNANERKKYYSGILGKKVQWSGTIERVWADNDLMGKNHIDVKPWIIGGTKLLHLITNQDISMLNNFTKNQIIFVGYIYRIDKKGELYIKTSRFKSN